jgi:hypothetical protein
MSIWNEVERVKGEIQHLREAIDANPDAGRYVRALQARVRDYGKLIRRLAEIELARPLPRKELRGPYVEAMRLTIDEREWLEGRADCPHFKGRESDLAALRAEHWSAA